MNPAGDNQPFVFAPEVVAAGLGNAAPTASVAALSSSGPADSTDALVDVTRREIGEIVREVAAAARSQRSIESFLAFFVDRIQRAMAAEGVIVWQRSAGSDTSAEPSFQPLKSIGRLIESSIPSASIATHQRLLLEIAQEESAAVVPPTPGAADETGPANPMDVPVAVVTIESNPSESQKEYLLEIFLDAESGVATQRGYLRFAAQMADLAGEFFRAAQLRNLHQLQMLTRQVDDAITQIHQPLSTARLEAVIVDQFADLFDFAQAALCYTDSQPAMLAAVSHVDRIDRRSDAAQRLSSAADCEIDDGGIGIGNWPNEHDQNMVATVVEDTVCSIRLIGVTNSDTPNNAGEFPEQLRRFANHAGLALQQANRFESIPGLRWIANLAPALTTPAARRWTKPLIVVTTVTLLLVVALFPLPMLIEAKATARPAQVQTLTVPRDAIVSRVHVDHGQTVHVGDPLVTLTDPNLEREITELVGRRAILIQQQDRWTDALVDMSASRTDQNVQLEGQRRLVVEEIDSIDQQLELLSRIKQSLVIRSDRQGTVDGWRLHQRLHGRPLSRGDHLLNVVQENSGWIVEAQIPQNRISQVEQAVSDETLAAEVYLESDPNQHWQASLLQVGPCLDASDQSVATTAALLRLERDAFTAQAGQIFNSPSGAPARVVFRCGSAPVAFLLLRDVMQTLRGSARMYLGFANEKANIE